MRTTTRDVVWTRTMLNMAVGQTRGCVGRDPGASSRGDFAPGYVEHGRWPMDRRNREGGKRADIVHSLHVRQQR